MVLGSSSTCIENHDLVSVYRRWRPAFEESEDFLLIVALAFFQETGVLDVHYLSIAIEDDEDREAETLRMIQALHEAGCRGLSPALP